MLKVCAPILTLQKHSVKAKMGIYCDSKCSLVTAKTCKYSYSRYCCKIADAPHFEPKITLPASDRQAIILI